jgi:hypothetical protein
LAAQDARWRPLIAASLRGELTESMKDEMFALVHHVAASAGIA